MFIRWTGGFSCYAWKKFGDETEWKKTAANGRKPLTSAGWLAYNSIVYRSHGVNRYGSASVGSSATVSAAPLGPMSRSMLGVAAMHGIALIGRREIDV